MPPIWPSPQRKLEETGPGTLALPRVPHSCRNEIAIGRHRKRLDSSSRLQASSIAAGSRTWVLIVTMCDMIELLRKSAVRTQFVKLRIVMRPTLHIAAFSRVVKRLTAFENRTATTENSFHDVVTCQSIEVQNSGYF